MAWIVRMPKLGQTMTSGTVQQWLKKPGESVQEGECLLVIESDKFVQEIEARQSGILQAILIQEGGEVPPGTPIGLVVAPGEALSELPSQQSSPRSGPVFQTDPIASQVSHQAGGLRASPAARRLAEEEGVDLSQVEGNGPEGAVTREDVLRYLGRL